ncbi:MAG: hypothetical protein MOB07_31585 [Acidobacteria bacterium]|nr:hypothetical protein [Acidobacteriota bacterium]
MSDEIKPEEKKYKKLTVVSGGSGINTHVYDEDGNPLAVKEISLLIKAGEPGELKLTILDFDLKLEGVIAEQHSTFILHRFGELERTLTDGEHDH